MLVHGCSRYGQITNSCGDTGTSNIVMERGYLDCIDIRLNYVARLNYRSAVPKDRLVGE